MLWERRHKNIVELLWEEHVTHHDHIVDIGEDIYSLKIMQSKTLCKKSVPSDFFVADRISRHLFEQWHFKFAPCNCKENQAHKFLFPCIVHGSTLDFSKPFSFDNHTQACVEVAIHAGYPMPDSTKHGYTSNCVRRGIAATLGQDVKKLLHRHNLNYGRAKNSRVDLDVYCPDDVLQVGLL